MATRSRSTRLPTKAKQAETSPDELAAQIASNLTISSAKAKGKQKAAPIKNVEERRTETMRAVNAASQSLSAAVRKVSAPPSGVTSSSVKVSAETALRCLRDLRELCPNNLDVERAAGSIVAKLLALEMHDHAVNALSDMHPCLCALLGTPSSSKRATKGTPIHLLSLPLPSTHDPVLLTLASTYLSHSLTALCVSAGPEAIRGALSNETAPTLLTWLRDGHLSSLPAKHIESLCTRAYTVLSKSFASQPSSSSVFYVRTYALHFLVHTPPGTVEPTTFWDQAVKFTVAFVKNIPRGEEREATRDVLQAFAGLATAAEGRPDAATFLSGRGFVGFCEYWLGFAKRDGDVHALDRIAILMKSTSVPSPSSSKTTEQERPDATLQVSRDAFLLQSARICASFAQANAILEDSPESNDSVLKRLAEATSCCASVPGVAPEGEDAQRAFSKVYRALERLRRSAVKVVDSSPSVDIDLAVRKLLVAVVDALARRINPDADVLTPALDTLFVLARITLDPRKPDTYSTTYDFLGRASALVSVDGPIVDRANYVRCTSGAFHNIAGTLYQGGQYAAAVRFLRQGCELGVQALELRKNGEEAVGADDRREEGWKSLEEQLFRRWELLGVCCSKMGDRKTTHEAFVECVRAFPCSGVVFSQSGSVLFASSPTLKQLGGVIDRLTYLCACELLRDPADVSLRHSLTGCSAEFIGAVLERQADSLEGVMWKEGVREVVRHLLEDALATYSPDEMPIRRARVIIRTLELAYFAGPTGSDDALRGENEIDDLLARQDYGLDAKLTSYCPQYRASVHFWLALHAHKRADPRQTTLMSHHAEEGAKILKSLVTSGGGKPSPKPKSPKQVTAASKKASGRTTVARRAVTSSNKPRPPKTPARDPVTPKPRKALHAVSINVEHATPPRKSLDTKKVTVAVFENFEKSLSLLQMLAQLLGIMGLMLPKIHLLDVTRLLCQQQSLDDGYVAASVDLAHEYVRIGKAGRASAVYGQALHAVRNGDVSDELRARFLLRYSESLALVENVLWSSSTYCEALGLAERFPNDEKGLSTVQRIRTRVGRLERAAIAARTYAVIQYSREDLTASLAGMLQSLRLWNRAVETLSRLNPAPAPSKPAPKEDNPFELTSLKDALPSGEAEPQRTEPETPKTVFPRKPSMDGLEWRISDGLLTTLFALSDAYFTRGSAREAEYFAQQAFDFAQSLNAPAMASRALARKGEVQLHQGKLVDAHESFVQAADLLHDMPGIDTADIRRLRGDYNQISAKPNDAVELYNEALVMLEEFDSLFGVLDAPVIGPRKSTGLSPKPLQTSTKKEALAPTLLSAILRQHIWLLRDDPGDKYKALLERFLALPSSSETMAEENALMAKLNLHDVYCRFRADMFYSSLAESTIALPMGMSGDKLSSLSSATQDILSTLDTAEKLFWTDLAIIARRGKVVHVRDAAVSLALIRALQTSLGKAGKQGPPTVAGLLDASAAITLRREMLETIHHKFLALQMPDDLQWPLITPNGSPIARTAPRSVARFAAAGLDSDEEDDVDGNDAVDDKNLKQYWDSVRHRYTSQNLDAASFSTPRADGLPANWTVVNISVTDDKSTMFVTRQKAGREPLIFCVPLKGRRESDEDEHLTFDDALTELQDIIRLSDQGTRQAVNVKNDDPQARAAWWAERGALDKRMQELLENIEFCWLGAFKTILSAPRHTPPEVITDLRTRLDKVFKRSLHSQEKKRNKRVKLDDALIECFSTLSPKCRDEELEDLIYFILDLYQFHGAPIAIAEVDVDQVAVELRMALEEHVQRTKGRVVPEEDSHMFLVLDKNVQGIPWESIPILRGRSVSRIPSMEFLVDRLEFAKLRGGVDRSIVDPRKTYYVLNPSGDLKGTEGRLRGWLTDMHRVGWQGIVGHVPSEQQFLDALSRNDLVIYFGHGGAEQYVRSHKIRHLPRCASTMLWGCSSGALKDMGDFDRVGTPYNYMLAGCPTLVANIWDVTDRDIDKFSQSVFDKMHLTAGAVGRWDDQKPCSGTSIVSAVAEAREVCKLKYLTGAAPVVYGIPFYM